MQRIMLKSKIQGAVITGIKLEYEGSITIDDDILKEADILPGEQVYVLNSNNGRRFVTYTIQGATGSGIVLLNGPAARLGAIKDKVIVLSYCQLNEEEYSNWEYKLVYLNDRNRIRYK